MSRKPTPIDPEVLESLTDEEYVDSSAAAIWSYDDTGHDLTLEEQLFVRSYLIDREPVAALRRLNYADSPARLRVIANRYLANPEVGAAVEHLAKRLMAKLDVTAERLQRRIAAAAFFDIRQIAAFDHTGIQIIPSKYWSEEQAMAVQSIKLGQHGIEIKFHDGLRAAELLAKQIGLVPDETASLAKSASEAAANAVLDRIMESFDRVHAIAAPGRDTRSPQLSQE